MFVAFKVRLRWVALLCAAVVALVIVTVPLPPAAAETSVVTILPEEVRARDLSAAPYVVCLTFDDGPGRYTAGLLDVLAKYDVPATFYVTGQNEDYFPMIARAHEEGHQIALHTYTHEFADIYRSCDAFWDDIGRIDALVYEQTGQHSRHLRFPGGASNTISARYGGEGLMQQLAAQCDERGIVYCDWNVDTRDAVSGTLDASTIVRRAVTGAMEQRVSVILMHDGQSAATIAEAVDAMIPQLLESGCVFATVEELDAPIQHAIR